MTMTMTTTRIPLAVRAFGTTCSFVAKTRSRSGSRKAITTTRKNDIVRGWSTVHTIRSRNTPSVWLGSRQNDDNNDNDNDNSTNNTYNYNSSYDSNYQEGTDFGGNPRGASSSSLVKEVVESVLNTAAEAGERSSSSSSSSSESTARNTGNDAVANVSSSSSSFQQLFRSTLQRAYSTTAIVNNYNNSNNNNNEEEVGNNGGAEDKEKTDENTEISGPNATKNNKYANTTETKKQRQQSYPHHAKNNNKSNNLKTRYVFPFATAYKDHPALNHVALAHALWASVVRPNVDSVIDATCGNGNDSIVLAEILFGQHNNNNGDGNDDRDNDNNHAAAELLCVDLQARACEKTTEALREVLSELIRVVASDDDDDDDNHDLEDNNNNSKKVVRVLQTSHERLPRPKDTSSVGLIVYNLGWLPGNTNTNTNPDDNDNVTGKDCVTTMETTLASLVDAISLLRVGGMLSVVTYPLTSRDEDAAVRLFLTCLALRSSRTRTWEEKVASFVAAGNGFGDDDSSSINRTAIAQQVTFAMETVVERGLQTWRVSQNNKLGMESPPVLFTATRIK